MIRTSFTPSAWAGLAAIALSVSACVGNPGTPTPDPSSSPSPSPSFIPFAGVSTFQNNNGRTGLNASETKLTPTTVSSTTFGKLLSFPLDGNCHGQPLYAKDVKISGALHDVILAATDQASLYAFDADGKPTQGDSEVPLWKVSFIAPLLGITADSGIQGTPVLDPSSQTLFLVAKTKESGVSFQRLHAIDIRTGAERAGSPIVIKASDVGIVFDPATETQSAALTLAKGLLHIPFPNHGDQEQFTGWLLTYNLSTLEQVSASLTSLSASAPAADPNGILFFSAAKDVGSVLNAMSKTSQGELTVKDRFVSPTLPSGLNGPLLVSEPAIYQNFALSSTRDGTLLVLDSDYLDQNALQTVNGQVSALTAAPAFWQGKLYVSGTADKVKAFGFSNGILSTTPLSRSKGSLALGSPLSISANGKENGIVWALEATLDASVPAVLRAFDADNLSKEFYNSGQAAARDLPQGSLRNAIPTIGNGHVYFASANSLNLYGLLSEGPFPTPHHIPSKLSLSGLFTDLTTLTPAAGLFEYDVVSPLWSDGALKRRWISLPSGKKITFSPTQPWSFPEGTRLIKHFELKGTDGKTTRVETRVLVRGATDWKGYTYQWNPAQTDADLLATGATQAYPQQTWSFPSPSDCLSCHNTNAGFALGVRTAQLNSNFAYADATENQLVRWNRLQMFTTDIGQPSAYGRYANPADATQTLDKRARSYLATNCAHCHQPGSQVPYNIDFRFETPLAQMNIVNAIPTHGDLGIQNSLRVDPGHKENSVVWLRISTNSTYHMPPIATSLVDPLGTQVIGSWIDQLPPN
jgi:uncharacterized repeat protein (TIGR03806 family)